MKSLGLKLTNHVLVISQVHLGTNEDDGDTRGVVLDFRPPFGFNVVKRVGGDDGETNEEDIGLRVRQRAKSVIIFLASGIPKAQVHGATIDHDVGRVVVKDGGDVFSGEGIGGVRDEEASLTDGAIADYDTLNVLHGGESLRKFDFWLEDFRWHTTCELKRFYWLEQARNILNAGNSAHGKLANRNLLKISVSDAKNWKNFDPQNGAANPAFSW